MRLKELENTGVEITYTNKMGYINTFSGKLTFVSKESIIVIGDIERIIKRSSIVSFKSIKYGKKIK
jgi:hypothetical protein